MRFWITGLPRSRTAWLSRLFSFGRSYCFHDLSVYVNWQTRMDQMAVDAVGNSDCGLSLLASPPRGRYLIVKRDPMESMQAFLSMEPYASVGPLDPRKVEELYPRMMQGIDSIEKSMPCKVIPFERLDSKDEIQSAWDFLIGRIQPWSDEHWEEMRHLRVVVRPDTYEVI